MSCSNHTKKAVNTLDRNNVPVCVVDKTSISPPQLNQLKSLLLDSTYKLKQNEMKTLLPKDVFEHVNNMAKRLRTRNIRFDISNPEKQFYLDEGVRITVWDQDSGFRTLQMLSERTMHKSSNDMEYKVGSTFPVGHDVWIIEQSYFLGKPSIHVTYYSDYVEPNYHRKISY